MRVEDALKLASHVLKGRKESSPARIRRLIAAGETVTLKLPEPIPVHIVYFTAFVEEDGTLAFREDVYGIDADLMRALSGRDRELDPQQIALR